MIDTEKAIKKLGSMLNKMGESAAMGDERYPNTYNDAFRRISKIEAFVHNELKERDAKIIMLTILKPQL